MQVKITQVGLTEWLVAATVNNKAAALAMANRMLEVNPAAYVPVEPSRIPPALEAGPPIDPPEGLLPPGVAQAFMRDVVPADDDEGEPIPGFRCANGACVGD